MYVGVSAVSGMFLERYLLSQNGTVHIEWSNKKRDAGRFNNHQCLDFDSLTDGIYEMIWEPV